LQYWNANLFGLAKQWTPVMCSGLSLAGEPQVPFASLTMLLSYLLGASIGIMAGTYAYLTIGLIGAYLYSGLPPCSSATASSSAESRTDTWTSSPFSHCRLRSGPYMRLRIRQRVC
jgi:hypothetical protein